MNDDPEPTAPYLWQVLRAYIEHACMMFGLPALVAQRVWFTRAEHKLLLSWLQPVEALLRRLLLIEALKLKLKPAPPPERKHAAPRAMPIAAGAAFDPERPETWRAHFHLAAAAPARKGRAHAASRKPAQRSGGGAAGGVSAIPLALRLEALIRAFNQPAPLALRLARRLVRAPEVARRLLDEPPRALAHRPGWPPVRDAALLARAAYANSS